MCKERKRRLTGSSKGNRVLARYLSHQNRKNRVENTCDIAIEVQTHGGGTEWNIGKRKKCGVVGVEKDQVKQQRRGGISVGGEKKTRSTT